MTDEQEVIKNLIEDLQKYVDAKGFNISFVSLGYAEKLLEQLILDNDYLEKFKIYP